MLKIENLISDRWPPALAGWLRQLESLNLAFTEWSLTGSAAQWMGRLPGRLVQTPPCLNKSGSGLDWVLAAWQQQQPEGSLLAKLEFQLDSQQVFQLDSEWRPGKRDQFEMLTWNGFILSTHTIEVAQSMSNQWQKLLVGGYCTCIFTTEIVL